jgi:hypothetical protein
MEQIKYINWFVFSNLTFSGNRTLYLYLPSGPIYINSSYISQMSVTSIIDDHKYLCFILEMDALEYNTSSAYQTQIYDQIINNII